MENTKKRVFITGASGMLGSAFAEYLATGEYETRALDHTALNVENRDAVLKEQEWRPDWIIHCAGAVNADYCEENRAACFKNHVEGTRHIIELARVTNAKLLYPQSFLIFSGRENPITEEIAPRPLSVYGEAKWEAEQLIHKELPDALVVRMGGFFGGGKRDKNFVGKFARHLQKSIAKGIKEISVGSRIWQPTYTKDLAENSALLLGQEKTGLYNMASHGETSFFDVAAAMAEILGITDKIIITPSATEYKEKAKRPYRAVMENKRLKEERLDHMRPWKEALGEYLQEPYFRKLF